MVDPGLLLPKVIPSQLHIQQHKYIADFRQAHLAHPLR
jgi:hypothetical protein